MLLLSASISRRKWPINLREADLDLFRREIESPIPSTELLTFRNVFINSNALIFKYGRILPQSFVNFAPAAGKTNLRNMGEFLIRNYLLSKRVNIARQPCGANCLRHFK